MKEIGKIIDKIKKLFALSKSPNEAEAALALSKAIELMREYNIEHSDLVKDSIEDIVEIDFVISKRSNNYQHYLAFWISKAFNTKAIHIKRKTSNDLMKFVGSKADIAVSTYVYAYVMNLIEIKYKEYIKKIKTENNINDLRGRSDIKKDFAFGFVYAVVEKLKEISKNNEQQKKYNVEVENALIVVKNQLIDQYIKKNFNNVKEGGFGKIEINKQHFINGLNDGKNVGIYKGIDTTKEQLKIK